MVRFVPWAPAQYVAFFGLLPAGAAVSCYYRHHHKVQPAEPEHWPISTPNGRNQLGPCLPTHCAACDMLPAPALQVLNYVFVVFNLSAMLIAIKGEPPSHEMPHPSPLPPLRVSLPKCPRAALPLGFVPHALAVTCF